MSDIHNRLIHGCRGIEDDTPWSIIPDAAHELVPLLDTPRDAAQP